MKIGLANFLTGLLLLNASIAHAEVLAVYSKSSAGWPKDAVSVSFLETKTLEILKTIELGVVTDHNDVFGLAGPEGKFLYTVTTDSGKKNAELKVISTDSFEEFARIPLGNLKYFQINGGQGFVRITNGGSQLVILRKDKKKNWRLDAYDRADHALINSTELPKKLGEGLLLPNGTYVAKALRRHKRCELIMFETSNGNIKSRFEFPSRVKLRFEYEKDSDDLMVFATRRVSIEKRRGSHEIIYGDVVYLHNFDIETGEKSEGRKLGYEPTPIFKSLNNQYDYFGTRGSLNQQGLVLWRVNGGKVDKFVETNYLVSPGYVLVSERANRAVFFHKERAIFVDLETHEIVGEDNINIHPTGASLNSSDRLAYLKQDRTSKVGVVDLRQNLAIEVSRAGSVLKKMGYVSLALGLSMALATVTDPFATWFFPAPPDTSMMQDMDNKFLYVLNNQTDDITVLDSETLKRVELLNVKNPIFMTRQQGKDAIWVFGKEEVILIDTQENIVIQRHDDGEFAGAQPELGVAYFANDKGLHVINTSTGEVTGTVSSLPEAYLVVRATGSIPN